MNQMNKGNKTTVICVFIKHESWIAISHLVLCSIMKLYVVMTSPGFSGSSRWLLTPPTEITLFLSSLTHVEGPEKQSHFIRRQWISVIYCNEHHISLRNGTSFFLLKKKKTFFFFLRTSS